MKNRIWVNRGIIAVTLAGMCLFLNACAGVVKSTSGAGGGGGGTPAVTLSPASLTFASQTVKTTSAAQSVTLTNSGTATLNITSIAITGTNSGDFAQTNTCGSTVAASATCTISVTFTPTAAGSRTASVSITDDATGSPQTVSLTGTGASAGGGSPAVTLSVASLTFASQTVNTTSAAQSVTLTNSGTASLSVTSVAITGTNSGDFAQTNTCGSTVAANATCTISVTFTPTAAGSRTASVSITDDATGSPQTVSLTGTGASAGGGSPAVTLSVASLTFASQTVNTTSAAQSVTLTNSGTASLSVTSVAITGTNSGDFAQTNTCGSTVAANATCTISVTFTPAAAGSRTASVSVTDNATGSPHTISLTGTGASASSGTGAPAIFFTDLESGPNSGGESGNGTILTIYGERFGAAQGTSTVTVGGGLVANYNLWTDTKVAVAIGSKAATGEVLVQTSAGTSNGVSFTVRAGNIFCVSTSGSDSNSGAFSTSCWLTIVHAKNTIAAGDIAYVENGVTQSAADADRASLDIRSNAGTAGNPKALVAYPGATATIGGGTSDYGIRNPLVGSASSHWVIAGFTIKGPSAAPTQPGAGLAIGGVDNNTLAEDLRIVGNDISCPVDNCTGAGSGDVNNVKFYGNHVHDVGTANTSKLMHGVYFGTNSNHMDVGWNEVGNIKACRGIQFHSSLGSNQFDLHVHDNYIHDVRCDGINFATVDPSLGTVEAYNNVLTRVGQGPDPTDGGSDYAGVYAPNAADISTFVACTSNCIIKVYNNTMYDVGSQQTTGNGGIVVKSGAVSVLAQNNVISETGSEVYLNGGGANGTITCDTNLFFGAGIAPSSCTNSLNSDPLFVSITSRDFHLQSGSPAVDKGLNAACPATDKDGITRPQGALCDLGAYEFH